ncbi:78 kDa glucose-regulated protein [Cladochytrium replicatum]|nr:78 kDa glucose-regulated protein [Cladochytrium replicatum]
MKRSLRCAILLTLIAIAIVGVRGDGRPPPTEQRKFDGPYIGIDLGSLYSRAAVKRGGRLEIIKDVEGNLVTPSYVAYTDEGPVVGHIAKDLADNFPSNTFFDMKRLIGRTFAELESELDRLPYSVVEKHGKPMIQATLASNDTLIAPEEIYAMLLRAMKESTEAQLKDSTITRAVIAVPAYFDNRVGAAIGAGKLAGFTSIRAVWEPVAAVQAYNLENNGNGHILVYNLGASYLEVTVLGVENTMLDIEITVKDDLGGKDFDDRIVDHFANVFKERHGKDLREDVNAMRKLRMESERAKIALSTDVSTRVKFDSIVDGIDFTETLTREKFEQLNADLFKRTLRSVEKAIGKAGVYKSEIRDIVLAGGSSHIPKVVQLLENYFDGKKALNSINPEHVVALGAAEVGYDVDHDDPSQYACFFHVPLTLGIETAGGVMTPIVPVWTELPMKKKMMFTTAVVNQTTVTIKVFQGERPLTKDNNFLAEVKLTGLPPSPRGVPQIEVTFASDSIGRNLWVTARDTATGNAESITIKERLSWGERYEQMLRDANQLPDKDWTLGKTIVKNHQAGGYDQTYLDAQKFAQEDLVMREKITMKNRFEDYVYNVNSWVNDGRLSGVQRRPISSALSKALRWLESTGLQTISKEEFMLKKVDLEEVVTLYVFDDVCDIPRSELEIWQERSPLETLPTILAKIL